MGAQAENCADIFQYEYKFLDKFMIKQKGFVHNTTRLENMMWRLRRKLFIWCSKAMLLLNSSPLFVPKVESIHRRVFFFIYIGKIDYPSDRIPNKNYRDCFLTLSRHKEEESNNSLGLLFLCAAKLIAKKPKWLAKRIIIKRQRNLQLSQHVFYAFLLGLQCR